MKAGYKRTTERIVQINKPSLGKPGKKIMKLERKNIKWKYLQLVCSESEEKYVQIVKKSMFKECRKVCSKGVEKMFKDRIKICPECEEKHVQWVKKSMFREKRKICSKSEEKHVQRVWKICFESEEKYVQSVKKNMFRKWKTKIDKERKWMK